jgi:hypothetical protein
MVAFRWAYSREPPPVSFGGVARAAKRGDEALVAVLLRAEALARDELSRCSCIGREC